MKLYTLHIFSILISLITLAGCGNVNSVPEDPDPMPIGFGEGRGLAFSAESFSRDGSSGTGAVDTSADPVLPETIGVFGAMRGYSYDIFNNQICYHKGTETYSNVLPSLQASWPEGFTDWFTTNDWPYSPIKYWSPGNIYQFFAYAPHSSYKGAQVDLISHTYDRFQTFSYTHIPPYSAMCYMVAKEIEQQSSGAVTFDMTSISARVCVRFKIGEEYAKMRTIRVTKVSVNDLSLGGTYFQCMMDLTTSPFTIDVRSDNTTYVPEYDGAVIKLIPIFEDADGLPLDPTQYLQFGSLYVMPQRLNSLTFNVEYDVYDTDGKKIRAEQRVSNEIELARDVLSGYYYNVNILISPAYLYVLSDHDVKPDLLIEP